MSDRTIREVSLVSVEELFAMPWPEVSGHRMIVTTFDLERGTVEVFGNDGHTDDGPPPSGSLSDPTDGHEKAAGG